MRQIQLLAFLGLLPVTLGLSLPSTSMAKPTGDESTRLPERVTFTKDVAEIIFNNCTECHRPGEAAPFTLMNYEEVKKRAPMIQSVVDDRFMPPWHPDPTFVPLADARVLSDKQIGTIGKWIDQGMIEGDPSELPEMPEFVEGWRLGEPDLILTMPEAFEVAADGPDIFRNFVLPIDFPEEKWVKAVEIRPSARSVVHHSLFFLGDSEAVRKLDAQDKKPGFRGMRFPILGSLGGWAVGALPQLLPGDLASALPAHTDLVLQTHFHPSGKVEYEQTTVGIYFADGPPSRRLRALQVPPAFGRFHIGRIKAGDSHHVVENTQSIRQDVDVIGVGGHAHYICTEMTSIATLPDGSTINLFRIPRWDFNWQGSYYFDEPVRLPAGTQVTSTLVYDNSEANPYNPTIPPVDVGFGNQSTDEMGTITLRYIAVNESDRAATRGLSALSDLRNRGGLLGGRRGRDNKDKPRNPMVDRILDNVLAGDQNDDGKLTRDETTGQIASSFDLIDTDEDGVLSRDELETAISQFLSNRDRRDRD